MGSISSFGFKDLDKKQRLLPEAEGARMDDLQKEEIGGSKVESFRKSEKSGDVFEQEEEPKVLGNLETWEFIYNPDALSSGTLRSLRNLSLGTIPLKVHIRVDHLPGTVDAIHSGEHSP